MLSVNWITHDRPESILRSVRSYLALGLPSDSSMELLVSQTGSIDLEPCLGGLSKPVRILDQKRRTVWIRHLREYFHKNVAPGSTIDFALNGGLTVSSGLRTTGANRNALLLTRVGERFISIDDDVILENFTFNGVKRVNQSYHLSSSRADPCVTYFLKNVQSLQDILIQKNAVKATDFRWMHEQLLGSAQAPVDSVVAMTVSGILGDSGFSSPRMLLSLSDEALLALARQEGAIECATNSRLVWRQAASVTLKQLSSLMTPCVGFANDLLLPPFFPIGRNQDGAYPYALKACLPNAWIAHLNQSILHDPIESRSYQGTLNSFHLRINDWLILIWLQLLRKEQGAFLSFEQSYQRASEHFWEFGGVDELEFKQNVKRLIDEVLTSRVQSLESQIERLKISEHPGLNAWRNLALQEVQIFKEAAENPQHNVPIEALQLSKDLEVASSIARTWIQEYSKLLRFWPEIREIARRHPPF